MKKYFRSAISAVLSMCLVVPTTGCSQATTIINIATSLATAASAVALIEGNTTAANQINTISTTLVADVRAWVPGTSTQNIVQVANDLSAAIVAIAPITPTDQALILIATNLITQLISNLNAPTAALTRTAVAGAPPVNLPSKITVMSNSDLKKMHSDFVKNWNAQVAKDPTRAALKIK